MSERTYNGQCSHGVPLGRECRDCEIADDPILRPRVYIDHQKEELDTLRADLAAKNELCDSLHRLAETLRDEVAVLKGEVERVRGKNERLSNAL